MAAGDCHTDAQRLRHVRRPIHAVEQLGHYRQSAVTLSDIATRIIEPQTIGVSVLFGLFLLLSYGTIWALLKGVPVLQQKT